MSQPFILDSKLFDPAAIDPETASFVERIEKELSTAPPLYKFEPQAIREARAAGYSIFGPIKHVDGAQDRKVPARPAIFPFVFSFRKKSQGFICIFTVADLCLAPSISTMNFSSKPAGAVRQPW